MFLFKGDFRVNSTTSRGMQYVTFSFYDGDKDLFEKVGELISDSFQAAKPDELTNKSSVNLDMAIPED